MSMKAEPLILEDGQYVKCSVDEAKFVRIYMPGPLCTRILPIILRGARKDPNAWTWNGDTFSPTLKPSIKTEQGEHLCHTWVTNGRAQFLKDCSHELAGQTLPLFDVP